MSTSYVDLNTVHVPSAGTVAPATWGTAIRRDFDSVVHPPSVSLSRSTTVTSGGAGSYVAVWTEDWDTDSMHSTGSTSLNPKAVVNKTGYYLMTANVEFSSSTGGNARRVSICTTAGSTVAASRVAHAESGVTKLGVSQLVVVSSTGTGYKVQLGQDSGSTLTATAKFQVTKLFEV